jgi:hypothetical protein
MGCLLLTLILFLPTRLLLVLVWIFGDRVERAFDNGLVPLLGLLFLPLTTLVYALVWDRDGLSIGEGTLVALALLIDLLGPSGLLWRFRRPARDATMPV